MNLGENEVICVLVSGKFMEIITRSMPSLKRQPLHMEVAELVRKMIMDGSLKQGEQIKEIELCEQLSVSRTPLREALKTLHVEGLVEIITNRGCWVAKLSQKEYLDSFEILSALEGKAAELAVLRATDTEVKQLLELHQQMEQFYKVRDKQKYFEKNQQIHLLILSLAKNDKLAQMHKQLMNLVTLGRFKAIDVEQRWDESMLEHEELMNAFLNKEHTKAGTILSKHVMQTGITIASIDT